MNQQQLNTTSDILGETNTIINCSSQITLTLPCDVCNFRQRKKQVFIPRSVDNLLIGGTKNLSTDQFLKKGLASWFLCLKKNGVTRI